MFRGPPRAGSIFDVLEWPFKTAADAISSVVSIAPGGDWIKRAFDRGETWLADLARWDPGGVRVPILGLPLGQAILLTISGNVAAAISGLATPGEEGLIDQIAPALSEMAWAMPTYLSQHGDCFSGTYVQMFSTRLILLEKILPFVTGGGTVGDAVTTQVPDLINDPDFLALVDPANVQAAKSAAQAAGRPVPSTADALAALGASPDELAAKFHVRADAAALAVDLVYCGEKVYDVSTFDPQTGAEKAPLDRPAVPSGQGSTFLRPLPALPGDPTSSDVLQAILDAQRAGARDDQLVDLKAQLQAALAHEQDPTYVSPEAMKTAAAHGGAYAKPSLVLSSAFGVAGTLLLATAPLWGAVLYLRGRSAGRRIG